MPAKPPAQALKETDLYAPVKALLEARGYEVKAEVNDCDVVAVKAGAPTLIVELKLAFSIDLVLQGVLRLNVSDDVYLAVPAPDGALKRRNWRARRRAVLKLCRLLGLGLILVGAARPAGRQTEVLADPLPYSPRKNRREITRLMAEFGNRAGDPNTGGASRTKIVTAYRQDALRLAVALGESGEMKVAELRLRTGVARAAPILQDNHYGWFQRTGRGVYALSEPGRAALADYAGVIATLAPGPP